MNEHPILFCAEMIQAYLAGRKWETRRVIKPQPVLGKPWGKSGWTIDPEQMDLPISFCPYGVPGDALWIRETWQARSPVGLEWNRYKVIEREGYAPNDWQIRYAATDKDFAEWSGWNPSIFMPRWASRISFPIASIRAERVQDISEDDAFAEGIQINATEYERGDAVAMYRILWDKINRARGYGWDSPTWPGWVWVITFPKYEAEQ